MPSATWDDSLSVGIDVVDAQHRALIDKLNDVADAVEIHQGGREVIRTLGFLIDYTHFHFEEEERHMKTTSYPRLDDHVAKHGEFKRTLADLLRDFEEEGATTEVADAINSLLWNWLIDHIKGTDAAFGAYLAERGIHIDT